ncbi:hypothetical protein WMF20_06875 [Sorangium sp. So ce834]|uniref:hypothetical protein n=1 Tax=Sorangium sp. So ce834 TaxID=3133321 RepID=UPI003F620869
MRRPSWPTAAFAVAQAACSAPVTGEVMIAVQTDMAMPKDLDRFDLEVLSGDNRIINEGFSLGADPEDVSLPGTQGLTVSDDPSLEIRVTVRGLLRGRVRVKHTVVTTVPEDRVATLWMPLHFLCSGDEADAEGACGADRTCVAGTCVDAHVSAELLPDYVERDVLHRACFDVARCFGGADLAEVEPEGCTIAASDDVNVAIATEGDGVCGPFGCFVPLEAESEVGWRRTPEGRVALPKAICSPERQPAPVVVTSPVTASCPRKRIGDPLCAVDERQPVVLAARQRSPMSLAVSDEAVFWTEQGSLSAPADGAVKRVARTGGRPETLASGQAAPRQIALGEGGRVFWTNHGIGNRESALMRLIVGSNKPERLLDEPSSGRPGALEGLATNGDRLFWTQLSGSPGEPGSVGQMELSRRVAEPVFDAGSYPYRIAAADSVVCWTDHGAGETGEVRCREADAAAPVIVGDRESTPYGIALDARDPVEVFWVNYRSGEVVRGAVDGSRRDVLVEGCKGPYGVALDEQLIYWTNRGDGTVKALPRGAAPGVGCGAGQVLTLAEGQRSPGAIAAPAGAIYWVNEGSAGEADGAVVRRAKPPPPR